MIDPEIKNILNQFFISAKADRADTLQKIISKVLVNLRDRNMVYSSAAAAEISKVYAEELKLRSLNAWESVKKYFEKGNITFNKNHAMEIEELLKQHIINEEKYLSREVQSRFTQRMAPLDFKNSILVALASSKNTIFPKISAELNFYTDSILTDKKEPEWNDVEILLEPVQQELLITIVEAARNTPIDNRHKFFVDQSFGGDTLIYPSLSKEKTQIYFGDIEALAHEGLLYIGYVPQGMPNFDVTPLGFKYYEYLKKKMGEPVERIVKTVTTYLDSNNFIKEYPAAYEKWCSAEELLWKTDSKQQLTLIGHLCREAIQEFANYLVVSHNLSNIHADKSKTVARLKAVILTKTESLGDSKKAFLDALVAYWGTVIDLIQRQEHDSQKEEQTLVWEDARAVVFQTLIAMFEIDRNL